MGRSAAAAKRVRATHTTETILLVLAGIRRQRGKNLYVFVL
jgi:hypothetical protein